MRRHLLALLAVVLWPTVGFAQSLVTFQTVTFTDTAIGFTVSTIRPPGEQPMQMCQGKVEDAQIRYRYDGTVPTTTVGNLADIGDVITIPGIQYLDAFRGVRTGGTDGVVQFSCSRQTTVISIAPSSTVDLSGSSLEATVSAPATDPLHTRLSDGTIAQTFGTGDADSGGGTSTIVGTLLLVPAAGGAAMAPGSVTDGLLVNLGANNDITITTLPAGTNNIGDVDVASIAAGNNNIGDVDVASLPSVTIGTFPDNEPINVAQINGVTVLMNAGVTGTGSQRVTEANNSALTVAAQAIAVDTAFLETARTPVSPATATATTGFLIGGQYNVTPPTFTDGQQGSVQFTSSGALMVSGGGGGTEYVVNAAAPADPTGNALLMERDDALATLTEVEADWTNLRSNARGALWVELDTTVNPVVALSATDNAVLDDIADGIAVTNAGTFAVQESGAALTALQLLDNAISGAGFNITQLNGAAVPIGAGVQATALRVTIATDSTGLLSVDDNGGSLTVDGTVTVTDGAGSLNAIIDSGTITAVTAITNALPAGTNNIGDVDVLSIVPGTAATNLGKAVDAVAGATDTGVAILVMRDDALTTLTPADGDYTTLRVSSTGALHVTGAAGTTQYVEDVAATDGASLVAIGGIRRDTTPSSSANAAGDNATATLDANGRLYTNAVLYEADGTALTPAVDYTHDAALTAATTTGPIAMGRASAAAPTNVSAGDDAVLAWHLLNGSAVSNIAAGGTLITATGASLNMNCTGGCSGGVQYAEDLAHTTGDSMTMAGAVRRDTAASSTATDGDIATINLDALGRLYTQAIGGTAHDAAASTIAPLLVGAYASQAAPTDVSADNDAVRLWALRNGSLVSNIAAGGTLITATGAALNVSSVVTTFPDNEPFNVAQMNGVAVLMGNGVTGTGSQRVTIASDNTAFTVNTGTFPDNEPFNVAQINGVTPLMGNGASGTGALRVSIANDSTGILAGVTTVSTVTNLATIGTSVTPGTGATNLGKAIDSVGGATDTGVAMLAIRDDALTTLTPIDGDYVALRVSSTGALHVTGSAGVTEFAEDAAHSTGALGNMVLAVRNDAGTALAGTTGDYIPLMVNASGALYVTGGGGGTEYVVNAVAPADPTGTAFLMERDDALSALAEVEGDWTNPRSNANGALWAAIDGTVAVSSISTSMVPGVGAGHLGKAEDAVHGSGDTGVLLLAVRNEGAAQLAADGDYIPLSTDSSGFLAVSDIATFTQALGSATSLAIIDDWDETDRAKVNIIAGQVGITAGAGAVSAATPRVTHASDDPSVVALQLLDNAISGAGFNITQFGGVALPVEDVAETAAGVGVYAMTVRRDTLASSAGTTGDNATLNTNAIGAMYIQPSAGISGGASIHYRTAAGATEDEHEIKATAGTYYGFIATNTNAAARYLRCYNLTAANTTPGTSTVFFGIAIPGAAAGAGASAFVPVGAAFSTALTCALTTGAADTDVAEVAANEIKITHFFF